MTWFNPNYGDRISKNIDFEIIETNRLILRKITAESMRDLLLYASNEEITTYLNISASEIEAEREKAKKGFSTYNKSLVIFQIIYKESNRLIGWCGYHTWYTEHRRAEIGYGLYDDQYKQRGIMSEAIRPILHFGFETMNLNRVEAFVGPDNNASLSLVARFGFTKEGQMRKHYFKNSVFEDSVVFSLLKEEFDTRNI